MKEDIIAVGRIFELVQMTQPDGRVFEKARRAPGVRVIIFDEAVKKVLLTKEYRAELGTWDYRLPGGKVFDSLDEFESFRATNENIEGKAEQQAILESQQEAGIEIQSAKLYKKSVLGATVEWDLYVFEAQQWQLSVDGQELEVGEKIEADSWFSLEKVQEMILNGSMAEERIALVLLQWIQQKMG